MVKIIHGLLDQGQKQTKNPNSISKQTKKDLKGQNGVQVSFLGGTARELGRVCGVLLLTRNIWDRGYSEAQSLSSDANFGL